MVKEIANLVKYYRTKGIILLFKKLNKTERGNIVPTSENKACLCFYNECSRYSTKLKRKYRANE